ncbi:hypothetical protein MTP99_010940 [Tenebrio molitor]|nr:hypothetical protein MTP99_010940 [Tenebrio molitor]
MLSRQYLEVTISRRSLEILQLPLVQVSVKVSQFLIPRRTHQVFLVKVLDSVHREVRLVARTFLALPQHRLGKLPDRFLGVQSLQPREVFLVLLLLLAVHLARVHQFLDPQPQLRLRFSVLEVHFPPQPPNKTHLPQVQALPPLDLEILMSVRRQLQVRVLAQLRIPSAEKIRIFSEVHRCLQIVQVLAPVVIQFLEVMLHKILVVALEIKISRFSANNQISVRIHLEVAVLANSLLGHSALDLLELLPKVVSVELRLFRNQEDLGPLQCLGRHLLLGVLQVLEEPLLSEVLRNLELLQNHLVQEVPGLLLLLPLLKIRRLGI